MTRILTTHLLAAGVLIVAALATIARGAETPPPYAERVVCTLSDETWTCWVKPAIRLSPPEQVHVRRPGDCTGSTVCAHIRRPPQ